MIVPSGDASAQAATALQAYVRTVQSRFGAGLVDVLLFGSQARGDAADGSDIDVMVILDHPTEHDLSAARGLAFDIWLTHRVLLSIRAFSRWGWQALAAMHSLFYRHVTRDGVSLLPVAA
jgi:predicted nucleotidyltransferase